MHLTNYETADDLDMDNAKKRPLKSLFDDLKKQNRDVDKLWKEIQVKANISLIKKYSFLLRISF
jgi:hypothetical protein